MQTGLLMSKTGGPGASGNAAAPMTLAEGLARGYRLLSEYEQYNTGDQIMAEHYRLKAEQAKGGQAVPPDDPPVKSEDLAQARATLIDARDTLGRGANAARVAEAQVNFDCWATRSARQDPAAQWCRERFHDAMNGIDVAGRNFSVYFESGQEVPDEKAFAVIRRAAAAFVDRDQWRVHVTGHSDSKGNKNQNLLLSMRRALAVRNALAQNGVDLDKIVIEAEGPEKNRGGDEAAARRVDIAILPAYLDHMGNGPDITKIMPQYFGSEGPDL